MNTKIRILKDIFSYSSSTYFSQAIGLFSGIWIAGQLGPENYGVYNAVTLVLGYAAYFEFGALAAMGRNLPFYVGQNDFKKAIDIEGTARYMTFFGSIIASIIILLVSLLTKMSSKMAFGLQIMSLIVIVQQLYTYHRTILRCNNNFKELAQQQILFSIITACLTILLVYVADFKGRMVAAFITQFLILMYGIYRNPWKLISKFNLSHSLDLMRIGLPILTSGFIITLVTSIDRLMIITFIGATQLGYFGLSIMLISLISLIPSMASQVLFPRINYDFGKSNKNIETLRKYVIKPPIILSAILPFIIGPVFLVLPFIINIFLPSYMAGVIAARVVILGIYFYGILGLTDYFLVTTGKLRQYAFFGILALIFNIILDYIFIKMNYGIVGIAFGGTLITYFIYSTIVIGYALSHYTKLAKDWVKYFLKLWLPFLYMVVLLFGIEFIFNHNIFSSNPKISVYQVISEVLIYLLACIPLIKIITRELKIDFSISIFQKYFK